MDAKQLFFERYEGLQEYPRVLLDGMSDQQQRESPHQSLNPVAWILWHMARCEDVGVNRLLADRAQVLDDGRFLSRLALDNRDVGTGMSKEEVADLCRKIDLAGLAAYREAVSERTVQEIRELPTAVLADTLAVQHLKRVFVKDGAGGGMADAIVEAYAGQTKGWLLGHLGLTHQFYHIGQAFVARTMYGLPNIW